MMTIPSPDQLINPNVKDLKPSATLVINELSNAMLAAGKKIYKLGFGQSPFPVPAIIVQALKDNAHQKDYLPVKGLTQLRHNVANYYHHQYGIDCTSEDVMIGPGSKELLFLTQLIYQGEVLIPQPSWVSYEPQAHLTNKNHHWLQTDPDHGYLLNAKTLAEHCKKQPRSPRTLILNYPSNPTGSSLDQTDLEALASVARQYNITIISDEIYGEVHHTGDHQSIAQYYPEGTIISSGLSKWAGAGGWRLGTFVFPQALRWLIDKMAVVASETFSATSAPIQYAATVAYQGGAEIEQYLYHTRLILSKVGNACHQMLAAQGISAPNPIGGFYLMPNFSEHKNALHAKHILTSQALCSALLEATGVALLPLSAFGMSEHHLGARLAYVDFDGQRALELIRKDKHTSANLLAPKVIAGVQAICDWIATQS